MPELPAGQCCQRRSDILFCGQWPVAIKSRKGHSKKKDWKPYPGIEQCILFVLLPDDSIQAGCLSTKDFFSYNQL